MEATELLRASAQLLEETQALLAACSSSAQAAERRLKQRERLRREREALELQQTQLATRLRALRRERRRAKRLQSWRALAARQKEGRLVAERQQLRLRSAVGSRAAAIAELERMLQRRLREDLTPSEQLQSKLHVDADDAALFEEFLGDLDVVHAATDQVFRDCGLHETPLVPFRMEPAWNREGDVQYIEKLDVLLLPFSFEDTCEVMWESMRHVYRQQDRRHYDGAVDGENTVAVKLRLRPPTETGEQAEMTVLFVIRRYVEPGRMVIVWRALSEGEGKFFGMHCDETGWSVVCPSGNAGDEMMPTVMQTLVRFRPLNVRVTSADHVDGYHFTKLVVTSAEEDASEIARMMDALLLEVSS